MNKKEIFSEINKHLIEDKKPSLYFNSEMFLRYKDIYPINLLVRLKSVEQSKIHHPEGNVWIHTMLVVDNAAEIKDKSKDKKVFMWASLLHDIGKFDTTKIRKGRITSYDHDIDGERKCKDFLEELGAEDDFIYKVSKLVRYHMHILYIVKNLPFSDIEGLMSDTDFEEVGLLGLCDRLGRLNQNVEEEKANVELYRNKCRQYIKI